MLIGRYLVDILTECWSSIDRVSVGYGSSIGRYVDQYGCSLVDMRPICCKDTLLIVYQYVTDTWSICWLSIGGYSDSLTVK